MNPPLTDEQKQQLNDLGVCVRGEHFTIDEAVVAVMFIRAACGGGFDKTRFQLVTMALDTCCSCFPGEAVLTPEELYAAVITALGAKVK